MIVFDPVERGYISGKRFCDYSAALLTGGNENQSKPAFSWISVIGVICGTTIAVDFRR